MYSSINDGDYGYRTCYEHICRLVIIKIRHHWNIIIDSGEKLSDINRRRLIKKMLICTVHII